MSTITIVYPKLGIKDTVIVYDGDEDESNSQEKQTEGRDVSIDDGGKSRTERRLTSH